MCALGINLFRQLIIFLKPVLPVLATDAEAFLNVEPLTWDDHRVLLANHQLNAFKPLMTRIDPVKVQAMTDASKEDLAASQTDTGTQAPQGNGELEFYDFIIFVFFATVVGKLFFPADMPEWLRQIGRASCRERV